MAALAPVRLLRVELEARGVLRVVGRLAWQRGRIFFEYDPSFLALGLPISPVHLPLQPGVIEGRPEPFDGLHGVFNDSLPDGWGRLLLDRRLSQLGVQPAELTPLDRLAWVGSRGMGALVYQPEHAPPEERVAGVLRLDELAEQSRRIIAGDADEVLDSLLELGGSSGGARPKILAGVDRTRKRVIEGVAELPAGYTHWLIKFRSASDAPDAGAVEYAYSRMARAAGVEMSDTHLFPSRRGAGHFGTRRFDRGGRAGRGADDRRIHVHTACGLLHADHRLPTIGYVVLLNATRALTRSQPEVERVFHRMVFNVLAHNRDDHTKNHSFLMGDDGSWRAAPTYDVTFSSGPGGEHALDVGGEGRRPGVEHIMAVARSCGVSEAFARDAVDEVRGAVSRWTRWASEAGVSKKQTQQIDGVLNGAVRKGRAAMVAGRRR